eukprot:s5330_g3.t1
MGRISNAAMLKDAGFTEGMTVHRKSDDTIATIEKMAAGSITLKVGDALKTCSSDSFLKGDWKPIACARARVEAAGRFLRLLRAPKAAACEDEIPEEWGLDMSPEEKAEQEEEEWRQSTAAMEGVPAEGEPDAKKSEEQPDATEETPIMEETPDAAEEKQDVTGEQPEEEEDGHEDVPIEDELPDDPDLDDQGGADADDADPDGPDNVTQAEAEYEEMDNDMKDLRRFVEDEHKKKPGHEDDGHGGNDKTGREDYAYGGNDKINKYRNKGWKWNNKGKGWKQGKGWQHGKKGKGKGKWQWSKWQWDNRSSSSSGYRGDQGWWDNDDRGSQAANMLTPDRKGKGFYLPNQQGFLDNEGRPGQGLADQNKTRVRGGMKAQAQKRKQQEEQEAMEQKKHSRQMMDRLASLCDKALDKIGN